jgi:hypothetical protein
MEEEAVRQGPLRPMTNGGALKEEALCGAGQNGHNVSIVSGFGVEANCENQG